MKVLLVNPSGTEFDGYTNPPLGLLYLAGTLQQAHINVRVWDGCIEERGQAPGKKRRAVEMLRDTLTLSEVREALRKETRDPRPPLVRVLQEYEPDLVGIPCLTPKRHRAYETALTVKKTDPAIRVVLGGAHATIMWRQILEHYPQVDIVALGEAERTLLEIAQGRALEEIGGIAYRRDGKPHKTDNRPLVGNLDDLAPPAWGLVDLQKYPGRGAGVHNGVDLARSPRVPVIFTRGCRGRCDFCSSWWIWRDYRVRSPRSMADELQTLYRKYGVRHFCFADDALTLDRSATMRLCDEIIRRGLGNKIAWHATTRTDAVDEILLMRMREAGCYEIAYGVETGSQPLLDGLGKQNSVEQNTRAIRDTKKQGIRAGALIIVGNVGETEDTIKETCHWLKTARPDSVGSVGGLWVLPGTRVYRDLVHEGELSDEFWLGTVPYPIYTGGFTMRDLKRWNRQVQSYQPLTTTQKIRKVLEV